MYSDVTAFCVKPPLVSTAIVEPPASLSYLSPVDPSEGVQVSIKPTE